MNPLNVLRLATSMGGPLKQVLLVGCEPGTLGPEEGQMDLSEPVEAVLDEAVKLVARRRPLAAAARDRDADLALELAQACQREARRDVVVEDRAQPRLRFDPVIDFDAAHGTICMSQRSDLRRTLCTEPGFTAEGRRPMGFGGPRSRSDRSPQTIDSRCAW